MHHALFATEQEQYSIALLIKNTAFKTSELAATYVNVLSKRDIPVEEIIAFTLDYDEQGKASAAFMQAYLDKLLPALEQLGVKYLYCADAGYFKALTKVRKAEPQLGYVLDCAWPGYGHMKVVLGVNHKSLMYNPTNESKLTLSLETLISATLDEEVDLGKDIIHYAEYPSQTSQIADWLKKLHQFPALTVDIETFSLKFNEAGIGTICFAWNQHEGIAFAVDYKPVEGTAPVYGEYAPNIEVRALLRAFFETYQGNLTYHRANFDTKIMIYVLWMKDRLDQKGLLKGLHTLYRNADDTRIIAYLALNSTAGNNLGLKELAHEFAGNWAQAEINDITRIPLSELLEYNLIDGLSTWYVKNKHYPKMVEDQQEGLYRSLMMPSQKVITQVELSGMPIKQERVAAARKQLEDIIQAHTDVLKNNSGLIRQTDNLITHRQWEKDFADRKAKAKNPDKIMPKDKATFPRNEFNPNSHPQLRVLLYEIMRLPVIELTDTKLPATDADTLTKLLNHCKQPEHKEVLEAISGYAKAEKILSTFIPAFEAAVLKEDGHHYLHGSFNLGGTVSGRLSSSDPNLQNLPSGSDYGKLVKQCFEAPEGWLFCGADFNSLEDYISALTTKDPNKLKVYLEGYDGHCLRAYSYWPHKFPAIQLTPQSVNKIKDQYPDERQDSKAPTFALTISALAA